MFFFPIRGNLSDFLYPAFSLLKAIHLQSGQPAERCQKFQVKIFPKAKIPLFFSSGNSFMVNKNALSSVESRVLGVKQPGVVILLFRLEYKTGVVCHNVYTQTVEKIARRDRPHILGSNRCEAFENLLHIDIAPLRSTLSGILHSKN